MKTDPRVVPDLPEKTEMRTECGLSKKQAALYEQAVTELKRRLQSAGGIARKGIVLATLMQFKRPCGKTGEERRANALTRKARGSKNREDPLGPGVVLQPRKLQRLRKPVAAWRNPCAKRVGH